MNRKESSENRLSAKERKDLKVLALFTGVYCSRHHRGEKRFLSPEESGWFASSSRRRYCPDCREFLLYAAERRLRCPLDPKPTCKRCDIHCYRPGHRERVRDIMRFSGRHLVRRGRLDLLWHYWF